MTIYRRHAMMMAVIAISVCTNILGSADAAEACKVLVVSSFHDSFFYDAGVKEGIEEVLGTTCDLTYHYLEALTDPSGVETKAREAFLRYQALQPDGVIAVAEDAQAAFVVPYLHEKVKTPVMFNAIFFPEMYDYPAANVSGITLHWPIHDAIVFAQQLVPEIATVGFLFADEPTAHAVIEQISRERATYPVTALEPVVVTTAAEAVAQAAALKDRCAALYIGPISGLVGGAGDAFTSEQALFAAIRPAFGKATLGTLQHYVEAGLLCGVREFPQEQGQVSAEMLQQAMSGTPLSELPVTHNQFGQRMLNKTVLKELGITPSRQLLTGTEIVEISR